MKQKALNALIFAQLTAGLKRYGVTIPVKQGYQPTSQGRVTRCVYFWLLADTPEGWQYRNHITDRESLQVRTKETQVMASSFQVGALIPDDPTKPDELTAKDVTVICRQIVQSQPFVTALSNAGVGVRRASDIRNPQFVNELGNYEYEPSFDFTVTHKQVIIQLTDSIESVEFNLHRV